MEQKTLLRAVCIFIAGVCLVAGIPLTAKSKRTVTVKYDAASKQVTIDPSAKGGTIAVIGFENQINQTGWAYLKVQTLDGFPDWLQAYAAGWGEGYVTRSLTTMHWQNTMAGFCPRPYSSFCSKLSTFLTENLQWMKQQIQLDMDRGLNSPYWHQVKLFLYQAAGLSDGLNGKVNTSGNIDIDPMGFYLFQVDGDIEDLESVFGGSGIQRPLGAGSCSALIKLLPGNKDLFAAQDTWNDYQSMLRIIKVYDFPWHTTEDKTAPEKMAGHLQTFSSYPGTLMSGDDFYLSSSGLVTMETTIGNNNASRWQFVSPHSVLEGIRSMVANRLAKSGQEWATIFSKFNSGTYNNEWMIVDYKRFEPLMAKLPPGVLTVLDQIPGMIKWADLTELLVSQTYFPSYNVAYFPEIFNASGNQANVEKYGDWFTYDKTPRAQIFRRDNSRVTDLHSMTWLMRYNNFQKDPLSRCNCTPPYSAENAISARSDLNPKDGKYPFGALGHRPHGGTDMKLTSSHLFTGKEQSLMAMGGPTWFQQPIFQWSQSDFRHLSHIGHPDVWNFSAILFNASHVFPDY